MRDAAARVVRLACGRFSEPHHNLAPRIQKTLAKALLDPTKPLTTHYGALLGVRLRDGQKRRLGPLTNRS